MDHALSTLLDHPRVTHASALAREEDGRTLDDQARISAIPAPPFGEERRGRAVADLLATAGLDSVSADAVGNILGVHALTGVAGRAAAPLVVSAHLDTVFPEGTDVSVTRDGSVLRGPGISDDGRGLAVLVALARLLRSAGIETRRPVLFAATVGEEGLGDLRGVRHLFGPAGRARRAAGFISIDGAGLERVVVRGLGSRRYRIAVRGPGGHSWLDWGTPNPIHALGPAVARATALVEGAVPAMALTVARWGGGTSINAIPELAWIEVDVRGEDEGRLESVEAALREVVHTAVAMESRGNGALEVEIVPVGRRPAGATPLAEPLVQAALAATRSVGAEPEAALSSTDANVPMSLGIPALTLGGGGDAGGAHTTQEWYRNTTGPEGVLRALYTLLLVAGVR